MISSISVSIYGGTQGKALNNSPYISIGGKPNGFTPTPPVIVDELQSWIIIHGQDYTMYAMASKKCKTVEGQQGLLLIYLFLPAQRRLADGKSPLELLESINDCFSVQALRSGILPNTPVDNTPFLTIVNNFRLEERTVLLPVMQGHKPASFCVNSRSQLDALMRHSRYPVLSAVGHLELGYQCQSSISLTTTGKTNKQSSERLKTEKILHEQPSTTENSFVGGMSLDDDLTPEHPTGTSWIKKLIKIAAITIGGFISLFVVLIVVAIAFDDEDNNKNTNEGKVENALVIESQQEAQNIPANVLPEDAAETSNVRTSEEFEVDKERAVKAAKIAKEKPVKRKEEETARAKEVKAERERELAERENTQWQSHIKTYAAQCPIQLRLGVRITSISYTTNSITYTVSYEELSKYDLDSNDREALASDRKKILIKYRDDIPSKIQTSIIQKDKAGRNL